MNKTILVIGAGVAQVDGIKKARSLGYRVLASDGSANAPGLKEADESRVIDVKDVKNNLAWARERQIDGVTSYASDVSLPTVLALNEELGMSGLGRIPMEVSLDKSLQRQRFRKAGLAQPDFEIVKNFQELEKTISRLGFPAVLKPVDNAGSRGVSLVEHAGQLATAYQSAIENSTKGSLIVEEFIEGTELTLEGLSINGEHHILAISDKYKPEGSYRVATQLAYPPAIPQEQEQTARELITAAYNAAEIDNTPTHSEVILTKSGPKIVEIGCRGGGFYVFTRVIEAVSGYDIVGNWTRICAGDPVEKVAAARRGVVLRFFAANPGRLVRVNGLEEAQKLEGVEAGLFVEPGDIVPELKTDGSRTGWMIACAKDRKQAIKRANHVSNLVKFETEPLE